MPDSKTKTTPATSRKSAPKKSNKRSRKKKKRGRPRIRSVGISHDTRPGLKPKTPVHVTLNFLDDLPSMRSVKWMEMITDIIGEMRDAWPDARITEYSVQSNHMHMLCEAETEGALATLMKSFKTRLTLRMNKELGRTGTAYTERYHRTDLQSPTSTRNALRYVLRNDVHHRTGPQRDKRASTLDGCSSAKWHIDFSSGNHPITDSFGLPSRIPTSRAKSWSLTLGYVERGGGRLTIDDLPK